ncbi:short-chain fatty acid transporter [Acinetobacter larvae]|uniref:Short chain fatty acid transporter n=1 Tax=Acinetobacter larvae TaxID=1789224 RepID=A0A1B2LXZ4_9GAMM|nr:TIGR00366 family protein [Acinetobacter larvae]AOA57818.1 Short chain fatty acid transporter [Acinetobacter larvae]
MSTNTTQGVGFFERIAVRISDWSEKWFPDSYVFALLGVIIVALAAWSIGAPATSISRAFGDGFWSLIPFTLQMTMLIVCGYVVSVSKPVEKLIHLLARLPKDGRMAIVMVAFVSLSISLIQWAMSTVLTALLVIALAKRKELNMDYRAAAAAAFVGMGATWALGLSSSAAQLQANKASLPDNIYQLTGVIPFAETIFLWQSIVIVLVLIVISLAIAYWSAPMGKNVKRLEDFAIDFDEPLEVKTEQQTTRPGDWLETTPWLTILVAIIGIFWIYDQFVQQDPMIAISNLNTYNFLFLMLGLILHGTPRRFLNAVYKAVPACSGVLIQFPLYGSIAYMMTKAVNIEGYSVSHYIANFFVSISNTETFPVVMGVYSAVLGFFVPSGGGKWIIEAPYVMQAAHDLKVHLGWSVQVYNAAEALPNFINPFFMLPMLGILKLKAKDVIGFTVTQLLFHLPVVLFLLWILGRTLTYIPPQFS